jgi:hypothetical protein
MTHARLGNDIDRWPRWLLIAYYITFPVSGATLFALILLGYMFVSPVVMLGIYIYVCLPREVATMADSLSSTGEATKMMTLVLNTGMKLRNGRAQDHGRQGQMPEVQGREIAARPTHRRQGGRASSQEWWRFPHVVPQLRRREDDGVSTRLNTDPLYATAGILRRDLGQRLYRFCRAIEQSQHGQRPGLQGVRLADNRSGRDRTVSA